jgi:hypothetical protein
MRSARIALLFAACAAPALATAGLREGYDAYQLGSYDRALEEFLPLAARNDVVASYYLGLMFLEGRGVTRSADEGLRWLGRAADGGHTVAQLTLAELYEAGEAVGQDYRAAAHWMEESAYGGNADAQYYLGMYYRLGQGVVQDDALAYEWVHRSVEYALAHVTVLDAFMYLGAANEWGRGRRQDLVEAYKWYSLAAGYSSDDVRMLTEAGRAMDALRIRISGAESAEAGRRARAWREEKEQMYPAR